MSNVVNIVKFIGAWFCLIAACAFLVLTPQPFGFATALAVTSVAFSQAPANV